MNKLVQKQPQSGMLGAEINRILLLIFLIPKLSAAADAFEIFGGYRLIPPVVFFRKSGNMIALAVKFLSGQVGKLVPQIDIIGGVRSFGKNILVRKSSAKAFKSCALLRPKANRHAVFGVNTANAVFQIAERQAVYLAGFKFRADIQRSVPDRKAVAVKIIPHQLCYKRIFAGVLSSCFKFFKNRRVVSGYFLKFQITVSFLKLFYVLLFNAENKS